MPPERAKKHVAPVPLTPVLQSDWPESPGYQGDWWLELINDIPAIVWVANTQTFQFKFVSAYAETLLGYPSRLWVEQPSFWKERVYPEDKEKSAGRRLRGIRDGHYDMEYRLVASDGRIIWVRELGHALRPDSAEMAGVIVDLTQKRSPLQVLGDGKIWLRQVIDSIPVQIWSGPADGTFDFWNARWLDEHGLSLESAQGDGWQQIVHPEDRKRVLEAWHHSVANRTPYELRIRLRMANGQYHWFLCRAIPMRDEHGTIVRWFGSNTDIDDQKRAEDALRQSEQRWRAVFENAWVGVGLLDSTLHFVEVNVSIERMLGYSRDELRSMTCLDVTAEEDRPGHKLLYDELQEGKHDNFEVEQRYRQKSGEVIWVRVNGSVIGTGSSRLWVVMAEDITERKRLDHELQQERDRLRLLLDLNHHFISELDVRDLFNALLDGMRRLAGWDWASILLPDSSSDRLTVYLSPDNSYLKEGSTLRIDDSLQGRVYRSGKAVAFRIEDLPSLCQVYRDNKWMQRIARAENIRAGCALPLIHEGRVIGVLFLMRRVPQDPARSDLTFLRELAALVAATLYNSLRFQSVSESRAKLLSERNYIEADSLRERGISEIIGNSPQIAEVRRQVSVVAPTDSAVLITGETGTGKELIARAIHEVSPRHDHSFIKIDCAAIPAALMESELFGHEKGAFTGATAQKLGRFELADHGTVFLDEVGDVPLELQPKLLRVLEDHAFERLGSTRTRSVDVRVIAATHRDLEKMVEDGAFREDLYYRLKVFPLLIPPLRDRASDIELLVKYYVAKYAERMKKLVPTVPQSAMEVFLHYRWPGNVRELQHFIERSVVLTSGRQLQAPLSELQQYMRRRTVQVKAQTRKLEDIERESILEALERSNWVVGGAHGAAAKLGLKRTTLASRIERLGISRKR
jgi:formate hydrogenlyase transcriptional activator